MLVSERYRDNDTRRIVFCWCPHGNTKAWHSTNIFSISVAICRLAAHFTVRRLLWHYDWIHFFSNSLRQQSFDSKKHDYNSKVMEKCFLFGNTIEISNCHETGDQRNTSSRVAWLFLLEYSWREASRALVANSLEGCSSPIFYTLSLALVVRLGWLSVILNGPDCTVGSILVRHRWRDKRQFDSWSVSPGDSSIYGYRGFFYGDDSLLNWTATFVLPSGRAWFCFLSRPFWPDAFHDESVPVIHLPDFTHKSPFFWFNQSRFFYCVCYTTAIQIRSRYFLDIIWIIQFRY